MPSARLIYNPAAGQVGSASLIPKAVEELRKHGWSIEVEKTKSSEHAVQLSQQAANEGIDILLVAGGDGSLEKAITGLMWSDTALAVLPVGTGNVFAREIGLPTPSWKDWRALEECARRLANAQIRTMDIGICNQIPFLLWAGVGLDAFIVHSVEPRRRWKKYFGAAQYFASGLLTAGRWKGLNLNIQTEQETIKGHFLLAVLSNIRRYAGGLAVLSPNARLDDGQMELWLFDGANLLDAVRQVRDLWSGRHLTSKRVKHFRFQTIHIESDRPLYLQLDGDPIEAGCQVDVKILRQAIKILVPRQAPESLFTRPVGKDPA